MIIFSVLLIHIYNQFIRHQTAHSDGPIRQSNCFRSLQEPFTNINVDGILIFANSEIEVAFYHFNNVSCAVVLANDTDFMTNLFKYISHDHLKFLVLLIGAKQM